jgi:hypothetical protein
MAFLRDGRNASLDPRAIMTCVAGFLPGLRASRVAVLIHLLKSTALTSFLKVLRASPCVGHDKSQGMSWTNQQLRRPTWTTSYAAL